MLGRIKTWIVEILTAADLNAEFNNILNNGGGSLSSPRTADFDLHGYAQYLDGAGNTYFQANTTGLIDFYQSSVLLFRVDLSIASAVNGLTARVAATGNAVALMAFGADADISINLIPKGSGQLQYNGVEVSTTSFSADQAILAGLIFG